MTGRSPLIEKLLLMQESTKRKQVETLLHFQEHVHRRVKTYANFGRKGCSYEVPMIQPGYPLYDPWWIRDELLKMLLRDGFKASVNEGLKLEIDWSIETLGPPSKSEVSGEAKSERKKRRAKRRQKRSEKKMLRGLL